MVVEKTKEKEGAVGRRKKEDEAEKVGAGGNGEERRGTHKKQMI